VSEYGWTGKLLRVDLTSGNIYTEDTSKYVPKFLGGIGIAHKIAWDEIPKGTGAFDSDNLLMIMHGPTTGTIAPGSAPATVCGVGAQQLPEMFSWSGVGGWFHTELKFAGYDGIIIKGKAAYPCYLWIHDGEVEIKEAGYIWGMGTYDTQKELRFRHGPGVHSLCIGPAGENLVRIAIMQNDTENSAGQGGYGAVAGSKNLKAICVKGTKSVKVARPEELLAIRKEWYSIRNAPKLNPWIDSGSFGFDGHTVEDVPYRRHKIASCRNCLRGDCRWMFTDVPRKTRSGFHAHEWGCIGPCLVAWTTPAGMEWPLYDQGFEGGFEMTELINDYGLNEWELLGGMVIWIAQAQAVGVLTDSMFGMHIDLSSPYFWRDMLHMITYREGFGDLLAEGTTRTINTLGKEKFGETMYRGHRRWPVNPDARRVPEGGPQVDTPISLQHSWGFAGHDCGREIHPHVFYPDWIIRALMWMTITRDPQSGAHVKQTSAQRDEYRGAANPYLSEAIPEVAVFNEYRLMLKESLPFCDSLGPRPGTPLQDVEARMYSAVTGIDTTEQEMDKIAERIQNMTRALMIRNSDRDRTMEYNEIIPWYRREDSMGIPIDEDSFKTTIDNYLTLHGWDLATGWPTRAKYEELGLKDVADELESIGKLP